MPASLWSNEGKYDKIKKNEKAGERNRNVTEFLLLVAALVVFFIIVMVTDCHRFVIKEYDCHSPKLKKEGKIIVLSDLHNKSFGKENQRLFCAIKKQNPDLILIAGDMYTAAKGQDNGKTADFVCRLAACWPVYYGIGNHEHKTKLFPEEYGSLYEAYMKRLEQAGVTLLENERVFLPGYGMELYGLEIGREYYQKFVKKEMGEDYLTALLGTPETDRFNLLIAHNPDYFETYAGWGADLTVSGHVHGGLMKLPFLGGVISPRLVLFPRYDGGRFEKDGREMILSRGLGTHTLPIRIFNPGELVVLRLQ